MKTKLLFLLLLGYTSYAQNSAVLFSEDFEDPNANYSVTNGSSYTGLNSPSVFWNDTSFLKTNGNHSYHVNGSTTASNIWFETSDFSTVGNYPYLSLSFNHIGKLYLANQGTIEISIDQGNSWRTLNDIAYQGNSGLYNFSEIFNEGSYIAPSNLWESNLSSTPNNTWWVNELFDLRGYANDTINATGYPNVRLRFNAEFILDFPIGSGNFRAGWFIDEIKVEGDSCERHAPIINFDPSLYANCQPFLDGPIIEAANSQYSVSLLSTDVGAGMDKVELTWTKNGGSPNTVVMSLQNGSTGEYLHNIGAFPGDTVSWHVNAIDLACPNITRSPQSGEYTFNILANPLPSKCGTVNCLQNPMVINSFPWIEDFESSDWGVRTNGPNGLNNAHRGTFPTSPIGNWEITPPLTSTTVNDYAWCVGNGPTGSPITGPNSNHTPSGSKYLFSEGSLSSPIGSTTISNSKLTTPCILLPDTSYYALEFYYHFYGSDIGHLKIDIDTGSVVESWITEYFAIFGEQQSSAGANWKKAFVPLAQFKGKTIRIRFRSSKLSSATLANMAIDDLEISSYSPDSIDVSLDNIISPSLAKCAYLSNETIEVNIGSIGLNTVTSIPLAYQVNGGSIVRDTLTSVSLSIGNTAPFAFSTSANLSGIGIYTIRIWSELQSDQNPLNDTITVNFQGQQSINTFPFIETFESSSPAPDLNSTGVLNSNYFTLNNIDNSGVNGTKWMIYNDKIRNLSAGPMGGSNGVGNYLLLNKLGIGTTGQNAEFYSGCVDFTALTHPVFSFKYHNFATPATLEVKARIVGSQVWIVVKTLNIEQANKMDSYQQELVDLSPFSGELIELALEGKNNLGSNQYIAIDDLAIFNKTSTEFGLVSVETPGNGVYEFGSSFLSKFKIVNNSSAISGSFIFYTELTELCASGTPSVFTGQSASLSASYLFAENRILNASINYPTNVPAGQYSMKAWITVNNDNTHYNDTIVRELTILPNTSMPYYNDFENCTPDFVATRGVLDWEVATPNKGSWNNAHSGQNCWISSSDFNPLTGAPETLLTPGFQGFDTVFDAEIKFWHQHDFGNGYGVVQYLDNGQWFDFVQAGPNEGINWNTTFNSNFNGYVFTGNSGGWYQSSYPLSRFNGQSNRTIFRFIVEGDNSTSGWAIDEFEIYVPPQLSSSPSNLSFGNTFPQSGNNSVSVKITNTGARPIKETYVTIINNGVTLVSGQHLNFNTNIQKGASTWVPISLPINLSTGNNKIEIITSHPNNRVDERPTDDTLVLDVPVLKDITTYPFCTTLEQDKSFVNYSLKAGTIDASWIYGLPNKWFLNSANSGSKVWYTADSLYDPLEDLYLFTPNFEIESNKCYSFSFFHQFDTEYNLDGGTVDYTIDSGATWNSLGSIQDTSWFNTPHIQALDAIYPGWSGLSNGWIKSANNIQFFEKGKVQFRFRFASNSTIHHEGWAIDDVCFEEISGSCNFIGTSESDEYLSAIHIYPNPTSGKFRIEFSESRNKIIELTDLKGKTLQSIQSTDVKMDMDLSNYPNGIYLLKVSDKYDQKKFKILVQK